MHAFEVGQDDVSIEFVAMFDVRMFDDVIRDGVPLVAGELASASRARLGVHETPLLGILHNRKRRVVATGCGRSCRDARCLASWRLRGRARRPWVPPPG